MASVATKLNFEEPALLKARKIEQELRRKGGDGYFLGAVTYEKLPSPEGPYVGLIHVGNPYSKRMKVTTLPTRATAEEVEHLRQKVFWMEETCAMFEILAANYHTRTPTLFESPSAVGKTFCVNLFAQFLYGVGVKPEIVTCGKNLDPRDLYARINPRAGSDLAPALEHALGEVLKQPYGAAQRKQLAALTEALQTVPLATKDQILRTRKAQIAKELGLVSEATDWVLEPGPIPRAYVANFTSERTFDYGGTAGEGTILVADEFNRANEGTSNVFLALRGNGRRLREKIQVVELGNRTISRGKDTWLVCLQNPAGEDYEGTRPLDPALARGFVYVRMKDLSAESYRLAAEQSLRFKRGDRPEPLRNGRHLDFSKHDELVRELGEFLALFHLEFREVFGKWNKTKEQKIPTTLDDMATFCSELFLYPVWEGGGRLNLAESVRCAVRASYLTKFDDEKLFESLSRSLEGLLTGKETGVKRFRGKTTTREEILNALAEEFGLSAEEREEQATAELQAAAADFDGDKMISPSLRALARRLVAGGAGAQKLGGRR